MSIPIEEADDELAVLVQAWGFDAVRKVEKRHPYNFTSIVGDMNYNDYVVRLTADNPVVDLGLIDELMNFYLPIHNAYSGACTRSDFYGYNPGQYPWGMDVELFKVSSLRLYNLRDLYEGMRIATLYPNEIPPSGLSVTMDWYHDYMWIQSFVLSMELNNCVLSYGFIVQLYKKMVEALSKQDILTTTQRIRRIAEKLNDMDSQSA